MADMVVVALGCGVVGALIAYVVMSERRHEERARHVEEILALQARKPMEPVAGDPPWVRELLTRLIDTALPVKEQVEVEEDEPPVGSPGEYEPPPQITQDWTDPFFGLERDLVGGLAPGQGIPGIGEQADYSLDDHPMARGMEDVDGDGVLDQPLDHQAGDALFEEWMSKGAEGG